MIKKLSLLLIGISALTLAQSTDLVPVSYIDALGQTKNGFTTQQNLYKGIKSLSFRPTKEGKDVELKPADVKSINFENGVKYISSHVSISRHDDVNLTEESKATYNDETLFLRTIIEGNVNLYEYVDNNASIYFVKPSQEASLQQLQYRRYYQDGNIVTDNSFKNQLSKLFSQSSSSDLRNLRYNDKSLTTFIGNYSGNQNTNVTYKAKEKNGGYFTFGVIAGVTNSKLDIANISKSYQQGESYDFSQVGFKIGIDIAYQFPFSDNLSVFAQPSFQNFSAKQAANYDKSKTMTIDYNTIQLPLGVRYNVINKGMSKFYLTGMMHFNMPMGAKVENINLYNNVNSQKEELKTTITGALGVGYKYNDKLSAEVRYTLPTDIFKANNSNSGNWSGDMTQLGLVLGYRLF